MKNYYVVLGVKNSATQEEIKKAYKKKSQKYHPDKPDHGDEKMYGAINEAYTVLQDPCSRSEYDKYGLVNEEYQPAIFKLQETITGIIDNTIEDLDNVDLIMTMQYNTRAYKKGLVNTKVALRHHIKKYEKASSKIKSKNQFGKNIFHAAIDKRIKKVEEDLEQLDKEERLASKMLEILDNYEYDVQVLISWHTSQ